MLRFLRKFVSDYFLHIPALAFEVFLTICRMCKVNYYRDNAKTLASFSEKISFGISTCLAFVKSHAILMTNFSILSVTNCCFLSTFLFWIETDYRFKSILLLSYPTHTMITECFDSFCRISHFAYDPYILFSLWSRSYLLLILDHLGFFRRVFKSQL